MKASCGTARRAIGIACLALPGLVGCNDGGSGLAVTGEYPVAWVERALPRDDVGAIVPDDLRDPGFFNPGARLLIKRRAAPNAPVIDIATRLFHDGERYDVRDVTAAYDGEKLLFALRGPYIEDADDEDQPTWNIWEYDIATDTARRLIAANVVAEEGQDIMPAYLPDGRIVFASTRQRGSRAVLVDEGKPQFAALDDTLQNEVYALHVMDGDGTNIHQISFNASHDIYPTVLGDGHVLFARQVRVGGRVAMHLYRVRPDGRDLQPVFGGHSHPEVDAEQVQFARPRLLDDGRVLVIERPYQTGFFGGALAAIDIARFSDVDQPLDASTGTGGIAMFDLDAYPGEATASRGGRYADAVPLGDNSGRLLVSWSACRLQAAPDALASPPVTPAQIVPCAGNDVSDPAWVEAAPIYGVFVYDPADGSRLPVVVPIEEKMHTHLAVAAPRPLPEYIADGEAGFDLDRVLVEEGVGVLDIRSVYDIDGSFDPLGSLFTSIDELANPVTARAAQRPARWLRLEKAVAIPDRMVLDFRRTAFGVTAAFGMREILGYVPIEPDGSVRVKVPANIPFTFSVVDDRGRRIASRHDAWLQLVPGETRVCAGCHDSMSSLPHGRNDSGVPVLHAGAAGGAPYPNTQPSLLANSGETMAETRTRLDADALAPAMDMLYSDVWTSPLVRVPDADAAFRYADLATAAPASADCQASWVALCRGVIHYDAHIHPLWRVDRRLFAGDGVTVLADHTCTTCHNSRTVMEMPQLPAAQLDLRDGMSGEVADHMAAYRELLVTDAQQEIVDGMLVDKLVQAVDANGSLVFETDANGNIFLDSNGQPIPVMVTVPLAPSLVAGNARGSQRFFPLFAAGGSHAGWLTDAELRLLAEWVDIGAQYFNDPFAAPLN